MTQNLTRDDIIQYGLQQGYKVRDINNALAKTGMAEYNPLTYGKNWQEIPGRFVQQGKEFGRDLATLGGALVGSVAQGVKGGNIQEKFLNAINSEPLRRTVAGAAAGATAGRFIPYVGAVGGGLLGGSAALLGGDKGILQGGKDLVNAFLSTYNTSTKDIGNLDVDWRDVVQGAMQNPLYSGIDVLSFGVGKAIGKAGKSIANKTGMSQKVIPGGDVADFNRYLTNSKLWAAQNSADIYKGFNKLQEMPLVDREEIVKYIRTGSGNLEGKSLAVAKQIRNDLRTASDQLADMGIFSKDFSRDNTIADYVMANSLDTNLLHKDIMDIIQGNKLRPTASNMFEDKALSNRILNLIDEGERLYDEGQTAFLSQKLAGTTDPLGEVKATWLNLAEGNAPNYARVIGRATNKNLGNVLEDTLKGQLDRSANMRSNIEIFSDLINNDKLGIGIPEELKSKYISAFRDSLKRDIAQDRMPDYITALNNSGIETALKDAGKPILFESLKGFFHQPTQDILGRISKTFKKNVLGVPGWSVGNRLGNISLNAIEGVHEIDYADIGKYKDLIPDALKLQSSYNSYLGLGNEILGKGEGFKLADLVPLAFKKSATEFRKSLGRYQNSDKTIKDKARYIGDLLGDISNATASPVFELEAKLEFRDRAANYIRQAKRYADKNKMKLKDVLKKAKEDKNLFIDLNNKVNKSLGDYYGRNYALPGGLYEAMNIGIPFYRFPVQTIRTAFHDIANNPIGFASNITVPARAGNVLSNKYMSMFGLDPQSYEGGVPYAIDEGSVRTMSMIPPTPGIVLPRLLDPEKFAGMINPLLGGNIADILKYKKYDKTPSSPRYTETKFNRPMDAIEYKPTASERAMFGLNEVLGTMYNPYIWGTRIVPQLNALATGQGMTPFYNTMQPIAYKLDSNNRKVYEFERGYNEIKGPVKYQLQNPRGYRKTTPLELLGGQVGISTRSNYPKRINRSQLNKAKNIRKNEYRSIEKNRGK